MTVTVSQADARERAGDAIPGAASRPGTRWPVVLVVAAVAGLCVPVVACIVIALTRTWFPPADNALFQIHLRDVGGPDTPLLGAYSRLGWNHPGPLGYWLLAIPYRLGGATTQGMLLGVLALNAASIAGSLVLARRRGGAALMVIVAICLAATVRGFGAAFLLHAWNPDIPALPTAFLVLAAWSVIEGDLRLLPAVIAVSCLAWQLHLGYLPVTGGLAAVAVLGAGARILRRRPSRRWPWGVIGATAVTAAVCLAPIAIEQATNQPGNLRLVIESFRQPREGVDLTGGDPLGKRLVVGIAAAHLSPVGTWISGDDTGSAVSGWVQGANPAWLLLVAVAVAGAALLAHRARHAPALRFLAVATSAALFACVAVSSTRGAPFTYLFHWFRPVSAMLWASAAWAVWCWARTRAGARIVEYPHARIAAAAIAALAVMAISVSSLVTGVGVELQDEAGAREVEALTPPTLAAVAGHDRVFLHLVGGWCTGALGHGLALQLIEAGTEVAVVEDAGLAYGRHRVRDDVVPTVELYCGSFVKDRLPTLPGRPIAVRGVLTDAEVAELRQLQERFRDELRAAGREDLVPLADGLGMVPATGMDLPGAGFDPRDVGRFEELMTANLAMAAVYWRPAGPNVLP